MMDMEVMFIAHNVCEFLKGEFTQNVYVSRIQTTLLLFTWTTKVFICNFIKAYQALIITMQVVHTL